MPESESNDSLESIFLEQKSRFYQSPMLSWNDRIDYLKSMKNALLNNQKALSDAVTQDFGQRPSMETELLELIQIHDHIHHTMKHLRHWMKPRKRRLPVQLTPGSSMILPQPKGVVGVISPWNYPLLLSLTPLITSISAGNHTMIKLSEYTPHTNHCLKQMLSSIFDEHFVSLIEGNAHVAANFARLSFDHLFFTGAPAIGKKVMASAAENLTPVTLELGGKSPVILDTGINMDTAAKSITFGKSINAGQTCIAPDYVFCHSSQIDSLIDRIRHHYIAMYVRHNNPQDYTSIITSTHYQRLIELVEDAKDKGAEIITIIDNKDYFNAQRIMPLTLVKNTTESMRLRQEEIFGPILPILTYNSINEVVQHIQNGPPPLALYLFSHNTHTQNKLEVSTQSGGMCINDTMTHFASQDLPFGGFRQSGIGRYHGQEGFEELSHMKSILKRGQFNPTLLLAPPWHRKIHETIKALFLR